MKRLLLFLWVGSMWLSAAAQERSVDAHSSEFWTGFTLKKHLNKRVTLNFDDQIRLTEESQVRVHFLEGGIKYRWIKNSAVKVQYRYAIRDGQRNTRRWSVDLSYKWKIKPAHLELKYRTRFQNAVVVYTGQRFTYFRNRLIVTYRLNKKWLAYGSFENFYRLNQRNDFRANRYQLGTQYRMNKQLSLKTFIQNDYDINVKRPGSRSVLGILVIYVLN